MSNNEKLFGFIIGLLIFLVVLNLLSYFVFNNKPISTTDAKALKYFQLVYGNDVPKTLGNKDLQQLDILWEDKLQIAEIGFDSIGNTECPNREGQVFKWLGCCQGSFDIPKTQWIYHPPPYKPLESNVWIEVTHCLGSWVTYNEQWGAWYYKANGSNMWLNIGNTITFKDHADAVKHFKAGECVINANDKRGECAENFQDLVQKAREAGYNTIQFLNHNDMRCGNTAIEILHVDSTSIGASLPSETRGTFKTGWWKAGTKGRGPIRDCDVKTLGTCEVCELPKIPIAKAPPS